MVYPMIAGMGAPVGWPDRLFVGNGKSVYVEFKGWNTPLRPEQETVLNELTENGVPAYVARFSADWKEVYFTRWYLTEVTTFSVNKPRDILCFLNLIS